MPPLGHTLLTFALAAACAGSWAQTSAQIQKNSPKSAPVQLSEPKVEKLAVAADPLKKAVLIGRVATGNMIFQLELEGSEPMWGSSGLHYSANSALLGDGTYAATVTVGLIDPIAMLQLTDNPEVATVAREARERLQRVCSALAAE